MKKQTTLTALLGLSQQEVAMLLGVNRSQWSMFESGQRSLPLHANLLLSEILTHMKSFDATKSKGAAQEITPDQLQRQLLENEYQQLRIARKIAAITKKQDAQARLLHLSAFLNEQTTDKKEQPTLHQVIAAKAARQQEANFSVALNALQRQLEILAVEKQWLDGKALGRQ